MKNLFTSIANVFVKPASFFNELDDSYNANSLKVVALMAIIRAVPMALGYPSLAHIPVYFLYPSFVILSFIGFLFITMLFSGFLSWTSMLFKKGDDVGLIKIGFPFSYLPAAFSPTCALFFEGEMSRLITYIGSAWTFLLWIIMVSSIRKMPWIQSTISVILAILIFVAPFALIYFLFLAAKGSTV